MARPFPFSFDKISLGAFAFLIASILLTFLLSFFACLLSLPALGKRIADAALSFFLSAKHALSHCLTVLGKLALRISGLWEYLRSLPKTGWHPHNSAEPQDRSKPLFHDSGGWQKHSWAYLGGCALVFTAALCSMPYYSNQASGYYTDGPFARKPISREVLTAQALQQEHNTILPFTVYVATPFAPKLEPLASAAKIFRAPAKQTAPDKQSEISRSGSGAPASARRHGPLTFNKGTVSIQTVAGDVMLNGTTPAPRGNIDTLPYLAGPKISPLPSRGKKGISASLSRQGVKKHDSWAELMAPEPVIRIASCNTKRRKRPADLHHLLRSLGSSGLYEKYGLRKEKYLSVAKIYAEKYQLTTSLLLAIIHTESGFNPSAVSSRQAIGLMQVVPHTAGNEVYRFLKGEGGTPSVDTLFNPENNIRYGATYLHLLDRYHFAGVINSASRQLCIIAGYNGGPNAVLRHFHADRGKAFEKINSMTTEEVYSVLTKRFPYAETRRYVESVKARMESYSTH